jgi:GNAT superfamily N-acetyltransferase
MVRLRVCTAEDVRELAKMNQMLIEDEKAPKLLSLEQLEKRMVNFLESDYKAYIFSDEGKTIGYALVNMSLNPIYLRHFFICREERRKGYGKEAMHDLMGCLQINEIDIEVYAWNERGLSFWRSLGFKERVYKMRLNI